MQPRLVLGAPLRRSMCTPRGDGRGGKGEGDKSGWLAATLWRASGGMRAWSLAASHTACPPVTLAQRLQGHHRSLPHDEPIRAGVVVWASRLAAGRVCLCESESVPLILCPPFLFPAGQCYVPPPTLPMRIPEGVWMAASDQGAARSRPMGASGGRGGGWWMARVSGQSSSRRRIGADGSSGGRQGGGSRLGPIAGRTILSRTSGKRTLIVASRADRSVFIGHAVAARPRRRHCPPRP